MKTLTNARRLDAAFNEAAEAGFSSDHQIALTEAGRKLGACLKEIEAIFDKLRLEPIMQYETVIPSQSGLGYMVTTTVPAEFDASAALSHIGEEFFLIGWDAGHIVHYAAAVEIGGAE